MPRWPLRDALGSLLPLFLSATLGCSGKPLPAPAPAATSSQAQTSPPDPSTGDHRCARPAPAVTPEPAPRSDEERALSRAAEHHAAGRQAQALSVLDPLLGRQLAEAKPVGALPGLRLRAMVREASGLTSGAVADLRLALDLSEKWIAEARAELTESQLAGAFAYLRVDEELVYSLAAAHPTEASCSRSRRCQTRRAPCSSDTGSAMSIHPARSGERGEGARRQRA